MFDAIMAWAADLLSAAHTFLMGNVAWPLQDALLRIRSSAVFMNLDILPFIAAPAAAVIGFVWFEKPQFARRHGASAASGWAFTMAAFTLGWLAFIYGVTAQEAARGAWTAATLASGLLWPIGLLAMVVTTYGVLGAHWIVRRATGAA